ncbi:MAG: methyltransferase domain-containing protein [Alphaproteobacteria bacterium GM202ARS2]|nr:methyltransferase domain-containing protein [Alphaproteobacteria bacterium GM202ARS2]
MSLFSVPARARLRRRFDKASGTYDGAAHLQERVAERLVSLAGAQLESRQSLLEVGSGSGQIHRALARHRLLPRLCLFSDISYGMLARGRKWAREARDNQQGTDAHGYCVCDGACLPLREQFDVVVASMSLHWFDDPSVALQSFMGAMVTGGVLLLAFPGVGSLESLHRLCGRETFTFPHSASIRAQLLAAGLRVDQHDDTFEETYETMQAFLQTMRSWGVMTPHQPLGWTARRNMLESRHKPIKIGWRIHYMVAT